jgi:hypothetical protein
MGWMSDEIYEATSSEELVSDDSNVIGWDALGEMIRKFLPDLLTFLVPTLRVSASAGIVVGYWWLFSDNIALVSLLPLALGALYGTLFAVSKKGRDGLCVVLCVVAALVGFITSGAHGGYSATLVLSGLAVVLACPEAPVRIW